jgi:protocatechuate 3,4-dioxygenase beta subunit
MAHAHDDESHHGGLAADLQMISRRRIFGMFAKAAAGLAVMPIAAGCLDRTVDTVDPDAAAGTGGSCSAIPTETAGPYPGDGTNGANALALAGIVRSDIRASIAGATGVAQGIELVVTFTLVDAATCEPLANHAVYLWHCDRDGNYSMYSPAAADENYLRGVQVTDAEGQVTFTTIVPACYSGRWPHIHFEIYASVDAATTGANKLAVSQLALPKAACDAVYATTGYAGSAANLARVTLASDNVFSDGSTLQIPTMSGSVSTGYDAELGVAI